MSIGAGPLRAAFDRRISPTPFSHVGYMTHVAEEIGYVITTVIPGTPWKAEAVLALLADEGVTVGQGVPSQWRLLLDRPEFDRTDLSRIRICGTGAAPVPPSLVREMQERIGCPVVIGYTSTEAALTTGSLPGDSPELIARTVGRARENVELRVVDDAGDVVPAGEVGNVECRSAAAMRGYWRDPDRTNEVLLPDGWLRTGDGGWLDEDGYLTLVGRRTEMYMRGAYNVYPVEVERVVSEHPAVSQVAIVGKPDPVLGEIGVAFVVPAAEGEAPSLEELRAWTRKSIADYKAPDVVELVPELPLTPMGKVDNALWANGHGAWCGFADRDASASAHLAASSARGSRPAGPPVPADLEPRRSFWRNPPRSPITCFDRMTIKLRQYYSCSFSTQGFTHHPSTPASRIF